MKRNTFALLAAGLLCNSFLYGQAPARGGRGPAGPQVVSPEVSADHKVTFRLLAPQAQTVRLTGGDIPGNGPGAPMTKGANGVWEVTLGPVPAGGYRYNFNVDGVTVVDPRSPSTSESNANVWSLVYVPGSDVMDTKDVPHGAVSAVTYYSTSLKKFRRMQIYTPPGYSLGKSKFPVFYLLHGASDSDLSWSTVGRATIILDNLIATKKAKPMIMVMPAGHTSPTAGGRGAQGTPDEFIQDFVNDIMPYVEHNYRVESGRQNRAMAGLSMGGRQTLDIAIPHLNKFAYIGVFSSGLMGTFGGGRGAAAPATPTISPAPAPPAWETQNLAVLDNAQLKKGLKLLWFSIGKEDSLLPTSRATVDLLKKHGFSPISLETEGGHTWLNWRNYLAQFTPLLFQ